MRKYALLIWIFFTALDVSAQTQGCKIRGILMEDTSYKYAHLYFNSSKKEIVTPIKQSRFEFLVDKPKGLELAVIFMSVDSLKSYANVVEEKKRGIHTSRMMVIEDAELLITDELPMANIKGGILNKELDQMITATKTNTYEVFFKEHLDSEISLIFIDALDKVNHKKLPFGGSNFNVKQYFNMLSERLRNSEEGKALWKKINGD